MTVVRTLTVTRPITSAPLVIERFAADPGRWLPPPARGRGHGRYEVELAFGDLRRTVLLELGDVWRTGEGRWRSCAWAPWAEEGEPVPGPSWLPTFQGSLGIRERGAEHAELVLHGSYTPPLGLFGGLLDATLMGRFARRTAGALLDRLATGLRGQLAAEID